MILVTGASGNAGGAVVDELRKTGAPFRAMYRSQEDAAKAPPDVATVIGDFSSSDPGFRHPQVLRGNGGRLRRFV